MTSNTNYAIIGLNKKGCDFMTFSQSTAIIIDNILKEMGYDRCLTIFNPNFSNFTEEELRLITKVTLENASDISFLAFLPNLKKVKISNMDYREVFYGTYEDNFYSNSITDFETIENLVNLEELEITNDVNLERINLANLKKLKRLILINNPRLKEITGTFSLHNLVDVCLVGNHIMSFPNFEQFLRNTLDAKRCIIDIDAYLWFLNELKKNMNKETATRYANIIYNESLTGGINRDIKFSEASGFSNYTTITLGELTDLYTKLNRRMHDNGALNLSPADQMTYLYQFGCAIPLAIDDIKRRNSEYIKIKENNNGSVPEYYEQSLTYLHNSFITYRLKKGNCEGIVNLLHVMASILGLESQTVYCHDMRDLENSSGTNHALLRIKIDNEWRYLDPTYDRESKVEYCNMDVDSVRAYAILPAIEEKVNEENDNKKYNRKNF